jgi:hypothetical protein
MKRPASGKSAASPNANAHDALDTVAANSTGAAIPIADRIVC